MYIISLILSVISCITAFLPYYGIIFTVVLGIISLVFSFLNIHSNKKEIKEISIISIIVCIFAFVICLIVNLYTIFYKSNSAKNGEASFASLSEDYITYSIDDEVYTNDLFFKINECNIENNSILLDYTTVFYGIKKDFSSYDFYILDESTDNIYYITYENGPKYVYSTLLENEKQVSGKMKFVLNDGYNIEKLYLVYKDDESSFKIKI